MQTNPTQATLELLNNILGEWRSHGIIHACTMLEAAFAEREARLVGALEPFAAMAAAYDPDEGDDPQWAYASRPTIGQVRKARATLAALKDRTHG